MVAINASPKHWINRLNDELENAEAVESDFVATRIEVDEFLNRCEAMRRSEEERTAGKIIHTLDR